MYSHCQGQVIRLYIFVVRRGWRAMSPRGATPRVLRLSDVVVVHGFSGCVTVMQEEYGHSPKHSHPALSAFGDLLPDGLHADVSRQLAFPSGGVDSG